MENKIGSILISDHWKRPFNRRPVIWCFCLLSSVGLLTTANARALSRLTQLSVSVAGINQEDADVSPLEPGKPIERELKGGQSHSYRITLGSGQYFRLVVKQHGIDVTVILQGPGGKQLYQMDNPASTEGEETLPWVTKENGLYQVVLRSLDSQAKTGRYEIRIDELRPASAQDETRSAGERAMVEGERLSSQQKAEASRQALAFFEEAVKSFRAADDRKLEAKALHRLGEVYADLGEAKQALELFNKSMPFWREANDRAGEAQTLHDLGVIYFFLGDFRKSLEYLQQALPIWRELHKVTEETGTLNGIGVAYRNLAEYQQASDYYDQALLLIRSSGEQTSEARRTEADVLINICTVNTRLGEMQRALDACTQAQSLYRQLNIRESEGMVLNRMALVLNHLGEYEKSLELNDESLRLLRLVGNRRQEAITLNDLGLTHVNLGNYSKAVEYYRQSLILAKEVKNRGGQLVTLHNLGVGYFLLGDKDNALDSFTQALELAREAGDREAEAKTLMSLGRLSQLSADLSHAIDYYQQALQLARAIKAAPQEASVLFYLAQAKRAQGNLADALARSSEALTITESLRTKVTSHELRSSFFASIKDRYDFHVDLLMQMHQQKSDEGSAALALQSSERARARSLLELLAEARTDIRRGADPALLQKERALQQQLDDKEQARVQLLSRKHTPEQAEAAEREIRALTTQSEELRLQVRARNPRYAGLTQPQPLTVADIQRQVLDKDTILLEYSLGEKRSFLWAVTPDAILGYQLPPRAEVEAAARRVYQLLVARQPAPELTEAQQMARGVESDAQYQVQAAALSRMLLGPVAAQLGAKRLLIVADGALQYLPFAALPTPGEDSEAGQQQRGRATTSNNPNDLRIPLSRPPLAAFTPLIMEHEIVSLPSASVLAVLRRELAGRQPAARMVAVLADPVFEPDDARLKLGLASRKSPRGTQHQTADTTPLASTSSASLPLERAIRSVRGDGVRAGLRRLLFSRDEAEAILVGTTQSSILKALDFQANRGLAMSDELGQYRIIHFATHGLLDSQHPELSGLVLSLVDEAGHAQDGFLRLHEIYNLRLNADLVVLSACQTGLGEEVRGEGLIGLTRGFMYAGAKRVVASLWQVDDAATAELMKRFYRGMMQEKLPAAAALRAAQIEMMKKKHWQSPYYWGAFVLQGEWR